MLEDAKMLSYYGLSAGDIVDLQTKCTECDQSCDVAHNNLGLRKRRDITKRKTVFDHQSKPEFMAACGKDFFLDGKFPEGFEETDSKKFICQTYKKGLPYFATKFDTTRKTADFSAYKPNIGYDGRPTWKDLYEHGLYDNDNGIQWYGIDTRCAWSRYPYSAVASTQGTDKTYYRAGKTFRVDRGHLNPSGMNSNNVNRMTASLTYTNIVPQFSDLNQKAWRLAEIAIRDQFVGTKCDPKSTYLLTGTVPSEMYLGYDAHDVDTEKDKMPKNTYPDICREGNIFCNTKYKVNIPAYMWTAGACYDLTGNCATFSLLAKNDGHENSVGFYNLDTLEKFLGAKSLTLSTCWTNKKDDEDSFVNLLRRQKQEGQKLIDRASNASVKLFPGCTKENTDYSQALVDYFKSSGWSHFLHSYIPPYVEKKRQQMWQNLEATKKNFPNLTKVLEDIQMAVDDLDTIVETDLTATPLSNCDFN